MAISEEISSCCKAAVQVEGNLENGGTFYYVCMSCNKVCDIYNVEKEQEIRMMNDIKKLEEAFPNCKFININMPMDEENRIRCACEQGYPYHDDAECKYIPKDTAECKCHCHNNHEGFDGTDGKANCKCFPNCKHCNPHYFSKGDLNRSEDWEEEFDKLMDVDIGTANIFYPKLIKNFISQLLQKDREKGRKEGYRVGIIEIKTELAKLKKKYEK